MSEKTFKITVKGSDGDEKIYLKHYIDMVYPCFEQFKQKVFLRFPQLREKEIKLYWIDSDNDQVTIFNEEDFRVFIDQSIDTNCRLFVEEKHLIDKHVRFIPTTSEASKQPEAITSPRITAPKNENLPKHVNVVCDACGEDIFGYRYKCLECPNYDLCMNCDKLMLHREHSMMRFYLPIEYSNWSRGHIDRLAKFIRKRNSKCAESDPTPVVGEMPKECEKKKRGSRHGRCHERKMGDGVHNFNLFKYMHDLANTEYGISKEETPIHAEEAARSQQKPDTAEETSQKPKKAYDVFEILSEITRPLGFELNIVSPPSAQISTASQAPTSQAPSTAQASSTSQASSSAQVLTAQVPTAPAEPHINKISTHTETVQQNINNPMDSKVPSIHNIQIISHSVTEPEKPKRVPIENTFDQPSIDKIVELNREEIFESHSNNLFSSTAPNNIDAVVTLQDDSEDSDKEWDVICEEIASIADNLRNTSPKSTGTIPKVQSESIATKNSSTNTSFDDIPKNVETEANKTTSTPPPTPRENGAGERNGNNVNFPNFEKLGRDLHKHIQEQMAETQAQVIHHRNPAINKAVNTMLAMGFSNEGGWLIQLLESVDGNISRALDLLQPVKK